MKKREPSRVITARELARNTAALLDEVESGRVLVVLRHRVPIATIEATEEGRWFADARDRWVSDDDEPVEELDLDSLGLKPEAFKVLEALERVDFPDQVIRETGLEGAVVRPSMGLLEGRRLTSRRGASFHLTELGQRALDAYRRAGEPSGAGDSGFYGESRGQNPSL